MCENKDLTGNKKALRELGNWQGLPELNERLERYGKAHKRSLSMADYISHVSDMQPFKNPLFDKMASRLGHCGSWLEFKDYYTVGEIALTNADFCKMHTLCPLCAIRRGAKSLSKYMSKVLQVLGENPNLKIYFVTFTVRDGPDLEERFNHLRKARQRMTVNRRLYLSNPNRKKNESCKAVGGISSIEIKRGSGSGLWHPHIHEIWLCEEEPDMFKLRDEWFDLTGDSFMVDVEEGYGDLVQQFSELFKYALKFSDMSLEDNWHAYWFCRGKNLMNSFGVLRGIKEDDELTDKELKYLPYILRVYKHVGGQSFDAKYSAVKVEKHDPDPPVEYEDISLAKIAQIRFKNDRAKGLHEQIKVNFDWDDFDNW